MRLLIFLLALMSAFFVSADEQDLVPAKEIKSNGTCRWAGEQPYSTDISFKDCADYIKSRLGGYSSWEPWLEGSVIQLRHPTNGTNYTSPGKYQFYSTSYECPPSAGSLYTNLVNTNMCSKPADCPAGYHSKAVSKALGSTECVPKECPAAGTGENLASSPMTGGVPFSGGGMYCNDGCAYSVNAEQISSEKYAVGTSQGVACGDKPYDNKKLADEGDTDGCSVATNGEIDILSCPNSNPTTPDKDPHNNDDSKVGEDDTPDKPKETCADGDAACNLKNVETQIENSSNKIIDNDNELHNKKIDADTKNTQAILNIMESVDTSILLQTSQDERLHAVTVSKYNQLIDAVNGLDVGGGGGGGNGNGNGTGEGDCEGSASDCVPIEGAEIPKETINLDQYADKYDDWLPNAELPSEKCIVLTNGKSICLSFEAFILLFQGISGLLVIGALMHSAKIISGAI
ncbi:MULTISPECIES: hypothetical protein [unclassified Pseudoalteromonas]|uniref:hypothetical protein n=1 Tax=unclassified Pseudoalteromonas TaxID=194690 RepID=UPI0016007360|nr:MULTISPECIES: hypothetical protein [unclassified Pseudoalteromonas]MBB1335964.1 hypothetical protein [Pseudoalteromonas sp. SR41-6]MBB1461526.1 hypothetical protein [Pseudoalteromonas sp. SG41-8]